MNIVVLAKLDFVLCKSHFGHQSDVSVLRLCSRICKLLVYLYMRYNTDITKGRFEYIIIVNIRRVIQDTMFELNTKYEA